MDVVPTKQKRKFMSGSYFLSENATYLERFSLIFRSYMKKKAAGIG